MKVVLRDYIKLLKEDGELDKLLVDLLFAMNIEPKSRPQKGRQFGVDIYAIGIDKEDDIKKVFLISVKQGDLNRANWDNGQNAIRPSINQIDDVYIRTHLTTQEKKYPIKIVIVFNGIIEQTVQEEWKGTIERFKVKNIELIEWDIDKIALMSEKYLFNEAFLPKESALLLRKALAFIDINDYDFSHITQLYNRLLFAGIKSESIKERQKRLRLLNVCLSLIFKWSEEQNNIRNALLASEKALLVIWKYMLDNKLLTEKKIFEEFLRILSTYNGIQLQYYKKTEPYCYVRDSVSLGNRLNHSEYCLVSYEFLGIYASIGLNHIFYRDLLKSKNVSTSEFNEQIEHVGLVVNSVVNSICHFLFNNPGSNYPQYDDHCIDICLVMLLLFKANRIDEAKEWLQKIVMTITTTYRNTSFFPLFYKNHNELVDGQVNGNNKEQKSSILITYLAEWSVILDDQETYSNIRYILKTHFPKMDLQLCFPDEKIEENLFVQNADRTNFKTKTSITLYEDFLEYKAEMIEELQMENLNLEKELSVFKNEIPYLAIVASRHYRTLVFPYFWRSLLPTSIRSL